MTLNFAATRPRNALGRFGPFTDERPSTEARFWSKVDRRGPDECWPWRAATNRSGYGRFQSDGKARLAHRLAYELAVGPIPNGLTVDHFCWTTGCMNPAHLRLISHLENSVRQREAVKPYCIRGHRFTLANTRILHGGKHGRRVCRACANIRSKAHQARQRAGTVKVSAG